MKSRDQNLKFPYKIILHSTFLRIKPISLKKIKGNSLNQLSHTNILLYCICQQHVLFLRYLRIYWGYKISFTEHSPHSLVDSSVTCVTALLKKGFIQKLATYPCVLRSILCSNLIQIHPTLSALKSNKQIYIHTHTRKHARRNKVI